VLGAAAHGDGVTLISALTTTAQERATDRQTEQRHRQAVTAAGVGAARRAAAAAATLEEEAGLLLLRGALSQRPIGLPAAISTHCCSLGQPLPVPSRRQPSMHARVSQT
jgi:hypothetical protein